MSNDSDLPSLDQVVAYVRGKGWSKESSAACCKVLVYSKGQDMSLTLPTSDKFVDYGVKMRKALELLSSIEGVPERELVQTIKSTAEKK